MDDGLFFLLSFSRSRYSHENGLAWPRLMRFHTAILLALETSARTEIGVASVSGKNVTHALSFSRIEQLRNLLLLRERERISNEDGKKLFLMDMCIVRAHIYERSCPCETKTTRTFQTITLRWHRSAIAVSFAMHFLKRKMKRKTSLKIHICFLNFQWNSFSLLYM